MEHLTAGSPGDDLVGIQESLPSAGRGFEARRSTSHIHSFLET